MTSNRDRLRPHKFRFQLRFTAFEQHGDHFPQVNAQFFKRRALRMGTRKSWHVTEEQFWGSRSTTAVKVLTLEL